MSWFFKLPFSQQVIAGCYLVAALFSIPVLVTFIVIGKILIGIVLILLLLGLTYPLSRFIERTLSSTFDEISIVTARIAQGDFTERANESGSMSQLNQSFNSMIDKLTKILTEASGITKQVMGTSRGITDKNQELKQVMTQVAISSNELAIGANEISQDIAGMTESIQDIEEKVSNYTNSTKAMNDRSLHTLKLVESGRQSVENQSEGMKKNIHATQQVASTIEALSVNAKGISTITKSISELAEQTNLLSLNASIEAARAGEHGRGFAVVASEVRKLAEESAASTQGVFNLVKSIEQDVQQAIHHIHVNEEIVREQNDMIREAEEIFTQIVQSVQYISEQIASFSNESDVMLESAHKISSSIQNISAITEESAAGTQQVSASMNEQISSIQMVVDEAETMNKAVFQLQKTIHIFKF
ncbi:methyl-accepting chemotaxis protein [Paenibacillus crassostreae]|uniref:Chemotaxis protein n=1 Tax=Paenibacillus crassostreae TaxID=1763538 RepID=A0A167FU77_9BACL|nr:methyl-accepting chemotaxis protein [Paenibacillus crassostreae]AOZ94061.1 methyl-accepting chemotaxis protein [Paenibacillus crassostreae]OAB76903.1 chemotaxis protein [Paenibacillus crassostreae]